MRLFNERPDGYIESIRKGSAGVSRFCEGVYYGSGDRNAEIERLRKELETGISLSW